MAVSRGGTSNAGTDSFATVYKMMAPDLIAVDAMLGPASMVFEPIFHPDDIANDISVISNERKEDERWYPANSELSWYQATQFINFTLFPHHQMMGSDEDLVKMSVPYVSKVHQACYFNDKVEIVVVGDIDIDLVL